MNLKFVTCTSRQLLTTIVTIANTATLATSTFQTVLPVWEFLRKPMILINYQ